MSFHHIKVFCFLALLRVRNLQRLFLPLQLIQWELCITLIHYKDTEQKVKCLLIWASEMFVYIKLARRVVLFGDYNTNQQVQFKRNVFEYQDYSTSLHKCFHRKKIYQWSLACLSSTVGFFICLLFSLRKTNQTSYLVFQIHELEIMLKKAYIPLLAVLL